MSAAVAPGRVALVGLVSMATAMGIGRFAFTPILPLMQQAQGVSLAQGAWLATVNYLGYLVGAIALTVRPLPPAAMIRWGLATVAVSTIAMGIVHRLPAWLVPSWALARLAAAERSELGGWIFGGVGLGVALAGLVAFVVGTTSGDPVPVWRRRGAARVGGPRGPWRLQAVASASATSCPRPSCPRWRAASSTTPRSSVGRGRSSGSPRRCR